MYPVYVSCIHSRQHQCAEHAGPDFLGDGKGGLNIRNMSNRAKGDIAYTLVDVDSQVPAQTIASIAGIEGVLAVRYLSAEA